LEYHKTIKDLLKEKEVEFQTHQPRQQCAYRVVIGNLHPTVQQELVRGDIERMGHKIRKLWNIRHRVSGNPFSLFFLDFTPTTNNSEIYHIKYLQNMSVKIEPPHQSKIIYHNASDVKRTSTQRGIAHIDQDA
jgi:hypothetical protein